eukprot:2395804-Rhodomonas_salina.1
MRPNALDFGWGSSSSAKGCISCFWRRGLWRRYGICLRGCYAMSGTALAHGASLLSSTRAGCNAWY